MSSRECKIQTIKKHIKSYPDFPSKGILFRDIFGVLENPDVFEILNDVLLETVRQMQCFDAVAALDSRGFLFGPLIALELHLPFIPIRKKGKLPGEVMSYSYTKEYGQDTLELQVGTIKPGAKVLLIDDLLATGGSLKGGIELIQKAGGQVPTCLIVIELESLKGRDIIDSEIISLIKY